MNKSYYARILSYWSPILENILFIPGIHKFALAILEDLGFSKKKDNIISITILFRDII